MRPPELPQSKPSFTLPLLSPANEVQPPPVTAPAPAPPSGRHRFALKVARAFIEALFTEDDKTPPPSHRMDWLQGELDQLLCRASWRSGGVYKLLLLLVCFVAPLHLKMPLPLWRLDLPERVQALRRMERGPLASVVLAAKAIICLIYYEHPEVAYESGYSGGCMGVRS